MLPEKFLERMQGMLGQEYEAFLEALGQEKYQALRLNPLKVRADGRSAAQVLGVAALGGSEGEGREVPDGAGEKGAFGGFAHLTRVPWTEEGYYYEPGDQPGKHPYHDGGLYYIQEPSAMAPVELLGVRPGQRVLDLCAAPGGKSTQIGAKLQGQGILICNEIHSARAKILSENIERMGICNACVTNESPERLADFFPEYFDRILVDAPCSGEGMFRKNEAACEEWSPENVALCAERQDGILDCAARMLRPGGRLVYSTCTFAPEEDEGSVERFLGRHEDFSLLPTDLLLSVEQEELSREDIRLTGILRLWPHRVKGEGHFAAVLRKEGGLPNRCLRQAVNGTVKGLSERELKELAEFDKFCGETLRFPACQRASWGRAVGVGEEAVYIRFGDHLYLVPAQMPCLNGLRVLRPGLQVGELKKNRFEPSHALALALAPEYAVHIYDMPSDEGAVRDYLRGGTFSAQGDKGWYLICADGFGIGWGKLAGGIMKNHYPKGLRRNL